MRTYNQLIQEQRYQIYALLKAGHSQLFIAKQLGVSPSTISRELMRNKGLRGYRPKQAHSLAVQRRKNVKRSTKLTDDIVELIHLLIPKKWSPEQISGRLLETIGISISHESIYQLIYRDKKSGGQLFSHLRHGHKKYRKRYATYDKRGIIPDKISIDNRPSIIDAKGRVGDWEIDTVIGKNHKRAIVTIVERVTKLTRIGLVSKKTSEEVTRATISLLQPVSKKVLSITLDNGVEFWHHKQITEKLNAKFYFAHPYHSWERGLNENTNGLIRQYLPKGVSFENLTENDILDIQNALNNRPRKSLGYKTPNEVFFNTAQANYAA